MFTHFLRWFGCILFASVLLGSSVFAREDLDIIELKSARVPDSNLIKVWAEAIVCAPIERVWPEVINYQHLTVGVPTVLAPRNPQVPGDPILVHMLLRFPWPLRKKEITLAFFEDPLNYTVKWSKVQGALKEHRGELNLEKHGEYTRMKVSIEQDTGFFVPSWLIKRSIQKKIPNEIWRVRRIVVP